MFIIKNYTHTIYTVLGHSNNLKIIQWGSLQKFNMTHYVRDLRIFWFVIYHITELLYYSSSGSLLHSPKASFHAQSKAYQDLCIRHKALNEWYYLTLVEIFIFQAALVSVWSQENTQEFHASFPKSLILYPQLLKSARFWFCCWNLQKSNLIISFKVLFIIKTL